NCDADSQQPKHPRLDGCSGARKAAATTTNGGVATMPRSSLHLLAAISVLSPSLALAQTPAPARQPNCDAAVRRQFDFWGGDWGVPGNAQHAGDNRIDKILGGCALLENWTGAGGMSGKSLNFYDPLREQWH